VREAVTALCLETVLLDTVITRGVNFVRKCFGYLFVGHALIIYLLKKKLSLILWAMGLGFIASESRSLISSLRTHKTSRVLWLPLAFLFAGGKQEYAPSLRFPTQGVQTPCSSPTEKTKSTLVEC